MLTFRPLRWYDCAFVYRLACDPATRAMSLDPRRPTPWGHVRHFWRDLTDGEHEEWVGLLDSRRAGHVYVDHRSDRMEIGVNVAAFARGKGVGVALIQFASARASGNRPLTPIVAYVKPANEASKRAFLRAGYVVTGFPGKLIRLEYRRPDDGVRDALFALAGGG